MENGSENKKKTYCNSNENKNNGIFSEHLILEGNRKLTVTGCRRIAEYSENRIRLQCKHYALQVEGGHLLCTAFGGNAVTVCGTIKLLQFNAVDEKQEEES